MIKKRMVNARVDSELIKAFKNTSVNAKSNGYKITLSGVVEGALVEAITEYEQISGVKFLRKGGDHYSID